MPHTHIIIVSRVAGNSCEITSWYAATPWVKRAWDIWLSGHATPADTAVDAWLHRNQLKLDRADGPAVVMTFPDGSFVEEWWIDGHLHRVNAPALLENNANGSQRELWYTHDKLNRPDGPAVVVRGQDGTVLLEQWYRDGVLEKNGGSLPLRPAKPPSGPTP